MLQYLKSFGVKSRVTTGRGHWTHFKRLFLMIHLRGLGRDKWTSFKNWLYLNMHFCSCLCSNQKLSHVDVHKSNWLLSNVAWSRDARKTNQGILCSFCKPYLYKMCSSIFVGIIKTQVSILLLISKYTQTVLFFEQPIFYNGWILSTGGVFYLI